MRQATDREEQWQQAAKPGTGSKQMQRFRYDQLRAGVATHRARMAEQRLHGKRRAGQYDRDCDARAPQQRQYGDQQHQAQQQPMPELRMQGDRRHGM